MSGDPEGELAALLPRLIQDTRIHFLDNLRSALIVLVIFHHAALTYAGMGHWYYSSPYHHPGSSSILETFVVVNQSYFMGALFFISGHFSAIAVDRKPWKAFVLNRLKRLGIPVVVYTLFLHPLAVDIVQWSKHAPVVSPVLGYFASLRGAQGPVWFLATLLVFDLVYVAVRTCFPSRALSFLVPDSISRYRTAVILCISSVVAASYLIRFSHPVGTSLPPPLGLQLAYAPQYIFAYLYVLVTHPAKRLALAYFFAVVLLAAIVLPFRRSSSPMTGGPNLPALLYATWNELCFYFIGTALFSVFHSSPYTTKKWGNTARFSYGAFLVHPVVLVSAQILVDKSFGTSMDAVSKTLVAGTVGTFLSWGAAWALLHIPGVGIFK